MQKAVVTSLRAQPFAGRLFLLLPYHGATATQLRQWHPEESPDPFLNAGTPHCSVYTNTPPERGPLGTRLNESQAFDRSFNRLGIAPRFQASSRVVE